MGFEQEKQQIGPFNPGLVNKAADQVFGEKKSADFQPTPDISQRFTTSLYDVVSQLEKERGIDFTSLSKIEQYRLALDFIKGFYQQAASEIAFLDVPRVETSVFGQRVIKVNPNTVNIRLDDYCQAREGSTETRIGVDRKVMLAYFTGLTQEKVNRFIQPWITREELSKFVPFTIDQLTDKFFTPFSEMGIVEKSSKGYRLACDPFAILKMLESKEVQQNIDITGFDKWFNSRQLLLENHQLQILDPLLRQCNEDGDGSKLLDTRTLIKETGLTRDAVYGHLRTLESQGLIHRRGNCYHISEINTQYLTQIVFAQEQPIIIDVDSGVANIQEQGADIEARRAQPLNISEQEYPEFPQVPWRHTEELDPDKDSALGEIADILTSQLEEHLLIGDTEKEDIRCRLPEINRVSHLVLLGILNFLGIGQREILRISTIKAPTLAAALVDIDNSKRNLLDIDLLTEVKGRLLTLIFGGIVTNEEAEKLSFSEVMAFLYEKIEADVPQKLEEKTDKSAGKDVTIYTEQEKISPPSIDEKLIQLMSPSFYKELAFATSQESIPLTSLMPTTAYNFHRSLSIKASRVPWQELIKLGLASDNVRDHHPEFEPVGALIAAVFLNASVHSRVRWKNHGTFNALRQVAFHVAHLLNIQLAGMDDHSNGNPQYNYIQACIERLSEANIVCTCVDCGK